MTAARATAAESGPWCSFAARQPPGEPSSPFGRPRFTPSVACGGAQSREPAGIGGWLALGSGGEAPATALAVIGAELCLGERLTAAKFAFSCVPSQKGLVFECPQRQRAIVSLAWY